ncbi:MAG: DUF1338 domain-containing protein [Bacteroidales bacterium]|jgi:hypothetical protein
MNTQDIFSKLWMDYITRNPYVKNVYDLFINEGEEVVNDHIAFRTFSDSRVNVDVLSKIFLQAGYVEKGQYKFEQKHLFAKHFEIEKDPFAPRVFISELITKDFSPFLQETITKVVDNILKELASSDELIFSGRTWGNPSFKIYEELRKESEYAAWLYVNGFTVNHFTVSVNALKKYDSVQKVNSFLKKNGFIINDAGGEIQGTPAELLEQSSVKAAVIPVEFAEGTYDVTSCYYEFAKRYPDTDGKLYSGFITKSADRIFQSTDLYKK